MLDDLQDMDEDTLKKVKLVVAFGAALVVLLVLALVLGESFGEKKAPRRERPVERSRTFPA